MVLHGHVERVALQLKDLKGEKGEFRQFFILQYSLRLQGHTQGLSKVSLKPPIKVSENFQQKEVLFREQKM